VPVTVAGETILARCAAALEDRKGILIMRPEDLRLSSSALEGAQNLKGKIAARQYLGSKTSYKVVVQGDERISVELYGDDHDTYPVGADVFVGVNALKASVIAS